MGRVCVCMGVPVCACQQSSASQEVWVAAFHKSVCVPAQLCCGGDYNGYASSAQPIQQVCQVSSWQLGQVCQRVQPLQGTLAGAGGWRWCHRGRRGGRGQLGGRTAAGSRCREGVRRADWRGAALVAGGLRLCSCSRCCSSRQQRQQASKLGHLCWRSVLQHPQQEAGGGRGGLCLLGGMRRCLWLFLELCRLRRRSRGRHSTRSSRRSSSCGRRRRL